MDMTDSIALTLWAFPSATTPGAASTTDFEQYSYDANGNGTSLIKPGPANHQLYV